MLLNKSNLLRYLTPGIIVSMVVGFSFVIPVTANGDKNNQCGYGYGYGNAENEQDENEGENEDNDEQCGEVGDVEKEKADTSDKTVKATAKANVAPKGDKTDHGGTHAATATHKVTTAHSQSGDGDKDENEGGGD
jgi:hypothetical protein